MACSRACASMLLTLEWLVFVLPCTWAAEVECSFEVEEREAMDEKESSSLLLVVLVVLVASAAARGRVCPPAVTAKEEEGMTGG